MPTNRMFPPRTKPATVQRICAIADGLRKSARTHVRSKVNAKRHSSTSGIRMWDGAACHCAVKYRKTLDHLT